MGKRLFESKAKGSLKNAFAESPASPETRLQVAGLVDEVPIEKKFLLYFSIVNMKKGIGQGW